jgi:DnaJ domain
MSDHDAAAAAAASSSSSSSSSSSIPATASATSVSSSSVSSSSNNNRENQAWSSHAKSLFDYTSEELWEEQCLTHYQVLNVPVYATTDQIKKAYRKCSLLYHPDKTGRGDDDYGTLQRDSLAYNSE